MHKIKVDNPGGFRSATAAYVDLSRYQLSTNGHVFYFEFEQGLGKP